MASFEGELNCLIDDVCIVEHWTFHNNIEFLMLLFRSS